MTGPLTSVRVIDLSALMAAPLATMIMGEQGADVIKVEPLEGDILRVAGQSLHRGTSAMFVNCNRAKRSIAINLKHPEGLALVRKLARGADVLVENSREGAMERLGLGYNDLSADNPRLIYARINGFGRKGPRAGQRVYDPLIQAMSGAMTLQDSRPEPAIEPMLLADKVTPIMLCQAVTAALFDRERTGLGQRIELSMLHSLLWWMWPDNMTGVTYVDAPEVEAYTYDKVDPLHRTNDGRYLCILAPSDAEWAAVSAAFDRPDWLADDRVGSAELRAINGPIYQAAIDEEVAKRTFADCLDLLDAADACYSIVNRREDVVTDEHMLANEFFVERPHPTLGTLRQPTSCVQFSRTEVSVGNVASDLNADALSVLRELDYGDDDIAALSRAGAIGAVADVTN